MIAIIRADARHLPLPDGSADLIITSPPYWPLRDYADPDTPGGYSWQIGLEPDWRDYLAHLMQATAEWWRVLKPTGSLVVNLGDSWATRWSSRNPGSGLHEDRQRTSRGSRNRTGIREKSLLGLPDRYKTACIDAGWVCRSQIVWNKTNGLPSSATDRFRASHEMLYHFTKHPVRYYHAFDVIREPHKPQSEQRAGRAHNTPERGQPNGREPHTLNPAQLLHPLGRMRGDVLTLPTFPLRVPAELGVDHHAAYPPDLVRLFIAALTPPGICTKCRHGRRPVVARPGLLGGDNNPASRDGTRAYSTMDGGQHVWDQRNAAPDYITGWACRCTPFTYHPERRRPTATPGDREYARDQVARTHATGTATHRHGWPQRLPVRDYHLDGWTPPPTVPAVVLDPFGGTGTTALVADLLGRHAITADGSLAYCRVARWRTRDPNQRAAAAHVPPPPPRTRPGPGQAALFD